ncbi:penicillin-binding protein 2 [Ectothiorhodospira sp. BSL-9]|uniref:penicillin-binding protein 2 n=1 Tax=Ectothiorhodospira sp. BSL-9 TaxID=1442136 RepID=UPI0007B42363|nr:penicillin-binding protein 2 [Ectothiorhodospira sp. BSL-9]ANB02337.1 penicillin-binding protein 2 [Ectothiorhodospira sp. BSL-9]TVQ74181.1 MAG: penicillin-binding protein 2 [Chromatiaceae bacterium]
MPARQPIKNHHQEKRLFLARVVILVVVVTLLFGIVSARLGHLQVASYSHFSTLSQNNRVRLEALPPPRGLIFDRNGVVLAENRPAYQLEITPEQVGDMEDTLERLAQVVHLEEMHIERFRRMLRGKRPFQAVPLKLNLSDEELANFAVNRHRFPGVDVEARVARHYPQGASLAHVLGYVGRIDERELARIDTRRYAGTSHIGKLGIERYYEDELHGQVGFQKVEVNAQGRTLRVLEREPATPGRDLVLSLDVRLQRAAEEILEGHAGAIVAMDPRNGEVLAMVSMPSFDPNLFVHGIPRSVFQELRTHRRQPLFNRALSGQYPPGSTLKPVVGLAGLEHGITTAERTMYTRGYYTLPNDSRRYRDWRYHGTVDLDRAIAQSSDVYFYDLGHKMGIDRMSEFLGLFGLGQRTGIDSTGERQGLLPTREWKRATHNQPWYPGETLITAIGQGYMLTTPLQLASVTSTLAMRGERVRPHLLRGRIQGEGGELTIDESQYLPPVQVSRPEFWDQVLVPMENTMHRPRGTAYNTAGRDAAYRIAGKTGTSQVFGLGEDEEYDEEQLALHLHDHALFIGYAPADDPRIAVAVIVEHGGSGGRVAAPMARKVMDYFLLEMDS